MSDNTESFSIQTTISVFLEMKLFVAMLNFMIVRNDIFKRDIL